MRHGGQVLADFLRKAGVARVFSVPGESFLAALDGLHESGIQNVVCRHEGAAAMMAEAYGKLTGTPGVAFVTRGPGATNASSGVHIAQQDSTPMILFVGQIAREHRDREAFQEVDYRAFFGPLAKWATEVEDTDRLPEYLARAFHTATSGRPGPVVMALPEDMLSGQTHASDAEMISAPACPDLSAVADEIAGRLASAKRPLIVVGGPLWSAQASEALARFSAQLDVPVCAAFRRQDYMDNRLPTYVGDLAVGGNPKLKARLAEADCLLVLGSRLGDIETDGYARLPVAQRLDAMIHVHAAADELGRVHHPGLAVVARASDMVRALAATHVQRAVASWRVDMCADYEDWQKPVETPGDVKLEQVITWLSETLPGDAILTNGAGNYAAWLHRYFRFKQVGTQLAPTSGSMGYGFPAAISAKLAHPERVVICLAGDGCFQMTLNEMSTAMQHGAAVIVVVVNNGRYGTIRMHQEKSYPGRVSGTDLANPDFAALARAYGGHGEVVSETAEFAGAFARARASGLPAIIELKMDPDMLATGASLSDLAKGA
ncbi:UNVERIFIED_CONTAM: hypothetical protein GTU68_018835 [Idotea baltica]|nr:hypothetical protein [Idotea baltica]